LTLDSAENTLAGMSEEPKNSANLTPLMRQYWDIKSLHADKILLFRMGDFFEMFFDDAIKAAPVVGIALTSRNKKSADETPMCGVPHHSIAGPINKLLKAGFKIAICDQIEDPKFAKGIVKRAVTRVLSPGMVYDSDTLETTQAHYLACYEDSHLACLDTTTGEAFVVSQVTEADATRLFSVFPIAELVIHEAAKEKSFLQGFPFPISVLKEADLSQSSLQRPADWSQKMGQLVASTSARQVASRLLDFVLSCGSAEVFKTIQTFQLRSLQGRMDLNAATLRHLELFTNSRGEQTGTLFTAINRTQTSAGARLLRSRLSFPLTEESEINQRLQEVARWCADLALAKRVREVLSKMGDIERRLGKISLPQCNARDLRAVAESVLAGIESLSLSGSKTSFNSLQSIADEILRSFVEDPPLSTRQGYLLNKGVNSQLDELILLTTDSQSLLQEMENREKEKTGISSLKIRYNNVFGYYIEITNTHKDKAPAHYQRKQTLANAERFCTEELLELERKVLSAQTRRFELEYEIFEQLRLKVLSLATPLLELASKTSDLDVATASAWLAVEKNYCRPVFVKSGLQLTHSRHPVVEQSVKKAFTPNSLTLGSGGCLLLTGPNMAGKSTLMRQVALISILAQAGLYVPAETAEIPLFKHLFTRIGASDQLSEGLSTFMVEMTETAEMLKKASPDSLLILDEIGRGTSTFDGMSLAQAILEHVQNHIRATTLFATHYHELTDLESSFPGLKNAHMRVIEKQGEIQFLHTLVAGPAQKSYGIYVAKLAGVPASVTKRAEVLLKGFEKVEKTGLNQLSLLDYEDTSPALDEELPATVSPILRELSGLQVTQMTPLQALQKLAEWQENLPKFDS
jgi:DNA mismatch repair protein MutS